MEYDKSKLIDFLSAFYRVDERILHEYVSYWSEYKISRKSLITKAGNTEKYLYFVQEGIQKSYFLNEDKEHVMFFAYAPSLSGIVESFLNQVPSNYYLESITDSKFLRISYNDHNELLNKQRSLETLFRKITEHLLRGIIERHHELMAFDIQERFKIFTKRSPHLLNMISQKDIASYLRIDPTNFSKLINSTEI